MKKLFLPLLVAMGISFSVQASPIYDIAILMDSSGSVGASDWALEQEFVVDLIENVIPEANSNFSIIQFASTVITEHGFNDDQTSSAVTSAVSGLGFTNGYTHTRDAIAEALDVFDAQSMDEHIKKLVMITDGNPFPSSSQNPCDLSVHLQASDIEVFIFGVGSEVNFSTIDCLVDDVHSQTVSIEDFSSAAFDAGVGTFADFLGISNASIYTTEAACVNAGQNWNGSVCMAVWPGDSSSVPEPSGLVLFGTSMVMLVANRRRLSASQRKPV